ncbi:unknown [Clostridium sp. CAG:715]|nr:unknown [Clostridium sp. CAG:715]
MPCAARALSGGGNRRLASLNCHTEDNSPKYRMIGNVVGLETTTCIFTDKVYSLFTTHHSLKRPGATHVALCESVGSYFRHWCGAFTLAEVLITLGIIGVVAAMTMPSLMQHYKRQQATARIKKFVSVINQALISAENDLGPREDWVIGEMDNSDSAYNFLNTYIKPYIKSADIEKRTLFGRNMATLRFVYGSQMSVKVGACYDIWYDINGEKGPNEKGKDIFVFILCKNGGCNFNSNQVRGFYCAPTGEQFPTHEQLIDNCKDRNRGSYCTILLEQNGYEFPKDYPLGL